jgi:hypothetical protein
LSLIAGDKTIKTICFLTQQVNVSSDLSGCIVGTHYTSLDINHSKGKAVRGLFWHGGHHPKGDANPKPSTAKAYQSLAKATQWFNKPMSLPKPTKALPKQLSGLINQ